MAALWKNREISVLLLLTLLDIGLVTSGTIHIDPKEETLVANHQVTVTCKTENSFNGCQFRIRNEETKVDSAVLELSASKTYGEEVQGGFGKYSAVYYLSESCVLTLLGLQRGRYLIGCRLYINNTGWEDEMMALRVVEREETLKKLILQTAVDRKTSLIHNEGESADVLCNTYNKMAIKSCSYALPGKHDWISLTNTGIFESSSVTAEYYGQGYKSGECGYSIGHVTEEHNGMFWCLASTETQVGHAAFPFIVARAPEVTLVPEHWASSKEGDTLTASCTASNGRPAATITWCLGGNVYNNYTTVETSWSWPWDQQTISQTVTIRVERHYFNHSLKCHVEHPSLTPVEKQLFIRDDTLSTSTTTPPSSTTFTSDTTLPTTSLPAESTGWDKYDMGASIGIAGVLLFICISAALIYTRVQHRRRFPVPSQRFSVLMENDGYEDAMTLRIGCRPQLPLPDGRSRSPSPDLPPSYDTVHHEVYTRGDDQEYATKYYRTSNEYEEMPVWPPVKPSTTPRK